MKKSLVLAGFALGLLSTFSCLLQGEAERDPNVIIERTATRDKALQIRRKKFDYTMTITVQKLNEKGIVNSSTVSTKEVSGDKRPSYIERAGPASSKENLSSQADKVSQKEPFNILNVTPHFTYRLEGIEEVNGETCYRIRFTPKKDMPYDSREEKVANKIAGRIWTSCADYSLVRNEGALSEPVSVAWFFATLRQMNYRFDAQRLPNGDFGPARLVYEFNVATPVGMIHQRHTTVMTHYRISKP